MQRKAFVLFTLLLVVVISLAACGGETTSSSAQTTSSSGQTTSSSAPEASSTTVSSPSGLPDASGDPPVTLSFGGTAAAEDLASKGLQRVADLCNERSGGSLKINVFPASQLGDAMTQLEMISSGSLDMFMEGNSYMGDYGVPDVNISGVFFQYKNEQEYLNLLDSNLFKSWCDTFLEVNGVRVLASNWMRPPVQFGSNVETRTFDSFKGLKIRSIPSEVTLATLSAIGCNPTSVAYNEVYLALQQGLVDATIATQDAMFTMNFYQVIKYMDLINASYISFNAMINEAKFQSLTPAQQQILSQTCVEVGEWYSGEIKTLLDGYLTKMKDAGVEIVTYPDAEIAKFKAAADTVIANYMADGKWSAGLPEKFAAAKAGND